MAVGGHAAERREGENQIRPTIAVENGNNGNNSSTLVKTTADYGITMEYQLCYWYLSTSIIIIIRM